MEVLQMSKLVLKFSMLVMVVGLFGSTLAQAEGFGFVAIAFNTANPMQYGAVHGGPYDDQGSIEGAAYDVLTNANGSGFNVGYNWAHNGWVALATGTDNNGGVHFGTASAQTYNAHADEPTAEQAALDNCNNAAQNGSCYVVRSLGSNSSYLVDPDGIKRN
jgi:hypothetical protein